MLADMVTLGNRVADVGCDHGFLSIYLVQNGISPRVLAMDVRQGPLAAAEAHIGACGLGAYIGTRLSDGLKAFDAGEAETLVCAGMGGRLMQKILSDSMEKAKGFRELILQPQSELREFRAFLRRQGFLVEAENAVCEEGKYYFAMKAVYAGASEAERDLQTACDGRADLTDEGKDVQRRQGLFDEYGELLLRQRHPVLGQYLRFRRELAQRLADKLSEEKTETAAVRLEEIKGELAEICDALGYFRRRE